MIKVFQTLFNIFPKILLSILRPLLFYSQPLDKELFLRILKWII